MAADSKEAVTGVVSSLWRYPVKSMQGERVERAEVTERGLSGDRAYALVETASDKIVSAKNPRKWAKVLRCRASFLAEPRAGAAAPEVRITFPSGQSVTSADANVDAALSAELGHGVSLKRVSGTAPVFDQMEAEGVSARGGMIKTEPMGLGSAPGMFFDFAPVHILATNTLDRLSRAYPQGRFDVLRFRPNIVLTIPPEGTVEPERIWPGMTFQLGAALRVNIVIPSPRCVMTTLDQAALPNDPGILRTIADHNLAYVTPLLKELPSVGVYGLVEQAGTVRVGDPLAAGPTTLFRKSMFWWTLARNLTRRSLPVLTRPFFARSS